MAIDKDIRVKPQAGGLILPKVRKGSKKTLLKTSRHDLQKRVGGRTAGALEV